jgi:hyperosmotically inducible protein
MNLRYKTACGIIAALLSSVAFAQTPSTDPSTQSADAVPTAKAQAHAAKKAERAANRLLSRKVQQAINKTNGMADSDVVVFASARTGKVTLAGFINDESQDRIATDAASKVPGVQSVTSKLSLREEGGQ